MNEKEILEYRQKSAEKLGFHPDNRENTYFKTVGKNISVPIVWKPDQDANQMLMVENWLIEQGIRIIYEYRVDDAIIHEWECGLKKIGSKRYDSIAYCYDKSKLIAFAKAFLEYDKQQ